MKDWHTKTVELKLVDDHAPKTIFEFPEWLRTMACVHPDTGMRRMPTVVDDAVFDQAADFIENALKVIFPGASEGWVEHDGKDMPVPASTLVDVRFPDGHVTKHQLASYWHGRGESESSWIVPSYGNLGTRIVAYRVDPPEEAAARRRKLLAKQE